LHPIRTERAASAATPFASLGKLLSSHRAVLRVSLAALSFIVIAAVSQQPTAQAGPEATPVTPESLLPDSVGIAVDTQASITIPFETTMDPVSVESAFELSPAQPVRLTWDEGATTLTVTPTGRWRSDERYLVVIGSGAARSDGAAVRTSQRFSFTTSTAPTVTDFQVHVAGGDRSANRASTAGQELSVRTAIAADTGARAEPDASGHPIGVGATSQPPSRTATKVSAGSSISIDFNVRMDRADVERRFAIAPHVDGSLSWKGGSLVFRPAERFQPGMRYTISLLGTHDVAGNALAGDGNFSFVVQSGARLTKTVASVNAGATPATISMRFSQRMDRKATLRALRVVDTLAGTRVAGTARWNKASTQLTFTPSQVLPASRTFEVSMANGGRDADGNIVKVRWSFTTPAAPVVIVPAAPAAPAVPAATPAAQPASAARTPAVPPAAPATTLAGYALNQVNAAREAYGFRPLVLDAKISAVAASHALDQAQNGYFSHTGRDGSSRETRLRRGGVTWNWWTGENQCYHEGMSQQATLNWCHDQFMAEPYPGHWNHKANLLNPNARRMGIGIATVGGRTVITWNFAD
jgi:uncharacterized protein YkwD